MPTVMESVPLLRSVPTAVVTLLPASVVDDVLAWHGLGHRSGGEVDLLVGRSVDVRPKPEPDGLLVACAALGVDPERAVMIGDSSWDAEAARRAGVRFIGVPTAPPAGAGMDVTAASFHDAVMTALA